MVPAIDEASLRVVLRNQRIVEADVELPLPLLQQDGLLSQELHGVVFGRLADLSLVGCGGRGAGGRRRTQRLLGQDSLTCQKHQAARNQQPSHGSLPESVCHPSLMSPDQEQICGRRRSYTPAAKQFFYEEPEIVSAPA